MKSEEEYLRDLDRQEATMNQLSKEGGLGQIGDEWMPFMKNSLLFDSSQGDDESFDMYDD